MRTPPIRRFGASSVISTDRFSSRNSYDKLLTSAFNNINSRPSNLNLFTTTADGGSRYRPSGLSYANNGYVEFEENRPPPAPAPKDTTVDAAAAKPEVIISTPSFELICDRRRSQCAGGRHTTSAADGLPPTPATSPSVSVSVGGNEKQQPKSALKKSNVENGGGDLSPSIRWTAFNNHRRTVSFADDKGLQLAEIKTITDNLSASDDQLNTPFHLLNRHYATAFVADFILPPPYRRLWRIQNADLGSSNNSDLSKANGGGGGPPPLALESYTTYVTRWNVSGVIAVKRQQQQPSSLGGGCEKQVFVRCSTDQWFTYTDIDATPISSSNDPAIQRYAFTLSFPPRPQIASRFQFKFGVRLKNNETGLAASATYWDDNNGSNYSFTFL